MKVIQVFGSIHYDEKMWNDKIDLELLTKEEGAYLDVWYEKDQEKPIRHFFKYGAKIEIHSNLMVYHKDQWIRAEEV